uniref:Uncharacterized protein n=1 Tax=Anguilla anguilla TaxID=7936 RepID=A0A0E9QNF9_ANGAN
MFPESAGECVHKMSQNPLYPTKTDLHACRHRQTGQQRDRQTYTQAGHMHTCMYKGKHTHKHTPLLGGTATFFMYL